MKRLKKKKIPHCACAHHALDSVTLILQLQIMICQSTVVNSNLAVAPTICYLAAQRKWHFLCIGAMAPKKKE